MSREQELTDFLYKHGDLTATTSHRIARLLLGNGYAKRSDVLDEAAKLADAQSEPKECGNLLGMDLETGVSDCTLEINGIGCLCAERWECADYIKRAILALKGPQ